MTQKFFELASLLGAHIANTNIHLFDAVHCQGSLAYILLNSVFERATLNGQQNRHGGNTFADCSRIHHANLGNRLAKFGINNGIEGSHQRGIKRFVIAHDITSFR